MDESSRTTWIVGAGSGVGRASAVALAGTGRTLLLSGRRAASLDGTRRAVVEAVGSATTAPVDMTDDAAVKRVIQEAEVGPGTIAEAVFCSGMNVPERYWRDLDIGEFRQVVDSNLNAVASGIAGVLPAMRRRGFGRIVVISSWAGWTLGRGAGVAYSASKTALSSLTESLNDQECGNGISACVICPGDIDTGFVDRRPSVPDAEARSRMLSPADVARSVRFVLDSPANVCINELVISPVHSHSYGK